MKARHLVAATPIQVPPFGESLAACVVSFEGPEAIEYELLVWRHEHGTPEKLRALWAEQWPEWAHFFECTQKGVAMLPPL